MQRERRSKYPPPPQDADDAHRYMKMPEYKDQAFATYYHGMVRGRNRRREGERALIYSNPGQKIMMSVFVVN